MKLAENRSDRSHAHGRRHFYSYDWLDNLGRPSADVLLPQYQTPQLGDLAAPMAEPANDRTAFTVAVVEPVDVSGVGEAGLDMGVAVV